MAETFKVLGQSAPAAATPTDLYTVPALKAAVISTIVVANRDSANARVRVSVAVGGAAGANQQYIMYDVLVLGRDFIPVTIGITLATTDVVRVYADTANVSFNLFGTEIDV